MFIGAQYVEVFGQADGTAENPEIIKQHGEQRAEQTKDNSKFQVIFFEYQNFQDFSSLAFKT